MPARTRKFHRLLLALLVCAGISSCSGKIPGVYRIPIQQGNVITVEMLQGLELGMDKRKVSFILGTPLVIDAFHLDRWDYFYSYQSSGGKRVQQRASLFFEGDRLARIDADIDSNIDFHTVTKATENSLIVPPKKKGGFLAALTPAFLTKDEEEWKQEEIAKSLSTGVNDDQPGSGATGGAGEVIDPALAAAAGGGTTPSEIYAPNASTGLEAARAAPAASEPLSEIISAKTQSQSRYLEQLFEGFGRASAPAPAAAATPAQPPPVSQPTAAAPSAPGQPTRD